MALDFDNLETYELLVGVCSQHEVDPSVPLESEKFFRALLSKYDGAEDTESVTSWLDDQISRSFISLGERPRWIQNYEWQFVDGAPAIFVGQIDVATQDSEIASQIFHDDTSIYVLSRRRNRQLLSSSSLELL